MNPRVKDVTYPQDSSSKPLVLREQDIEENQLAEWKAVLSHPENRLQIIGWVFDWEECPKPELGEWSLENAPNQAKLRELLISLHNKIRESKHRHFTPEFHNLLSLISLLREDHEEIKHGIRNILELLCKRDSQDEAYQSFENRYLDYLHTTYSRMRMIGVREMKDVKQKLSIAYVSLRIRSREGKDAESLPQAAESALVKHDLLTIRGSAGSGKTTLLHWIITQCSNPEHRTIDYGGKGQGYGKGDVRYETFNPWMGLVPFFVPLRKIETDNKGEPKGKPDMTQFVRYSDGEAPFNESPPNGWINDILFRQKRGIILIDGVDELPMTHRPLFWEWLRNSLDQLEGNRIIITSRYLPEIQKEKPEKEKEHPGNERDPLWDPPQPFHNAELEDMNDADTREFIQKWHDAVLDYEKDPTEAAQLKRRSEELPVKLLEDPANRRVRELCRAPLLCALVCVLHWKEEGYLPRKRVDLYERCCAMLIDERDRKRGLPPPPPPLCHLTANDKEMILQRLALDMLRNKTKKGEHKFATEVSCMEAISWIRPNLKAVENIRGRECRAEDVLPYLIERTSLLREPSGGRVDFPHRTFQEYLAACAAGAGAEGEEAEGGYCNELVNYASDDAWRQTIVLSAGTKTGGIPFGRRLIRALVEQGEFLNKNITTRNQALACFALSVACLETFQGPDPDLRARVSSKLGAITPPKNFDQAFALSAAGDALISHLEYEKIKGQDESVVCACVKTLSLVESKNSLRELKDHYSRDQRETVLSELCSTPGINPLQLPVVIQYLKENGEVPDYARQYVRDLFPLSGLRDLQHLDLSFSLEIKDISPLSGLTDLRSLSLRGCDKIQDLSPVSGLKKLEKLDLGYCAGIRDFSPLQDLPNLKSLDLQGVKIPEGFQLPKSLPSVPTPGLDFLETVQGMFMKMVLIEGGEFQMGSPKEEEGHQDDEGIHPVELDGFWISSVPITQKQYQSIMNENPSHFKGDDLPVECVSWHDSNEFCEILSGKTGREYSLPTEAQWEFSCRAGSEGTFCFGDSDQRLEHFAWYEKNSENKTHPVGQKRPNAWGLFDMHGNVWEWCADWYGEYGKEKCVNPTGPKEGKYRMLRGGSWCYHAVHCRSACRDFNPPDYGLNNLGFRVVFVARTQKK